jgi:4-hydroxybenzoate polyprenyltransferase
MPWFDVYMLGVVFSLGITAGIHTEEIIREPKLKNYSYGAYALISLGSWFVFCFMLGTLLRELTFKKQ